MRRWFAAGVELGWVIYPKRTVTVYRALDDIRILTRTTRSTAERSFQIRAAWRPVTALVRDRGFAHRARRNNLIPAQSARPGVVLALLPPFPDVRQSWT
jgi:hypothetical protein